MKVQNLFPHQNFPPKKKCKKIIFGSFDINSLTNNFFNETRVPSMITQEIYCFAQIEDRNIFDPKELKAGKLFP